MLKEDRDPLTERIIACCFNLHNKLGAGSVEKIYHNGLKIYLKGEGLNYESEKEFDVFLHQERIGKFRCDFFIEQKVILEIKSVTGKTPLVFENQLISYLKASSVKTGLLINFGNRSCEIKRLSV